MNCDSCGREVFSSCAVYGGNDTYPLCRKCFDEQRYLFKNKKNFGPEFSFFDMPNNFVDVKCTNKKCNHCWKVAGQTDNNYLIACPMCRIENEAWIFAHQFENPFFDESKAFDLKETFKSFIERRFDKENKGKSYSIKEIHAMIDKENKTETHLKIHKEAAEKINPEYEKASEPIPAMFGKTPFAIKADTDKNPLDLLPTVALESVGLVLKHGAKKYAAHNWRKGMKWSRLISALLRHVFAFIRGENTDAESGLPHMAHAACCVLFLLDYQLTSVGEDDRYNGVNPFK